MKVDVESPAVHWMAFLGLLLGFALLLVGFFGEGQQVAGVTGLALTLLALLHGLR